MNWKTTVALIVIVVTGALYIHFVEHEMDTTEDIQEKGKKVFVIKDLSDHIDKVAIKRKGDIPELSFTRKGDDTDSPWVMNEPLKVRADKSELKAIASAVEDLTIKDSVPGDAGKLSEYGLDNPRAQVIFSLDDEEYTLLIGETSPTDDDEVFVKRSDTGRVYLVSDSIYEKVIKELAEFRDKKVLYIEKDKVESLKLDWKEKDDFLASKTGGDWFIKSPIDDYADKSKIEGFIDKIKDLKIDKEDFFTENMDDPAKFGLEVPALSITIQSEADEDNKDESKTEYVLLLGSAVKDKSDKIYAKRSDEPTVFGLKKDILDDLEVDDLNDLRATDFAVFDDDDVNKIEIKPASGEIVVVEKVKKKEDDDDLIWKVTKPREFEAEESAVDNFVDSLDDITIEEFKNDDPKEEDLASYSLSKPLATVTISLKDDKGVHTFEFGAADKEDEEQFYARRAGHKNVFLAKKKGYHKDLMAGYLLFRDKDIIEFSKSDAKKVVVVTGGKTVVAKKTGDYDWQLTQPVTAPADSGNIDSILWAVNSLEAVRFVTESPKDIAQYGLDKPLVKATFEVEEEKDEDSGDDDDDDDKKEKKKVQRTITLHIGKKVSDEDEYYAKVIEEGNANQDTVFTITKYKYDTLTKELHDREVVDITKSEVKELNIRHKDSTLTCKRNDDDDDKWTITSPKDAEGKKSEIEDILDELDPLRAEKLASYKAKPSQLADYGLANPEVTVRIKTKDGKEKSFAIGSLIKENSDEYYHVKTDEKEGVYLIRKSTIEDINKKFEDVAKEEDKKEEDKKEETETDDKAGEKPKKDAPAKKGE